MKRFTFTMLLCIIAVSGLFAQYWQSTGALAGAGSSTYLTGATHVGETIFVVSMEQGLAYSTDQGQTWTKQTAARPSGTIAAITGTKDRLYASFKVNTYDFELYYSMDNGATWTIDTIGLPKNLTQTGKSGMILKYMGNDYILAHNYSKAVYKKLGDPGWKSTFIDNIIVDVSATSDKWLAIGQAKMLQSTNHGESWTTLGTGGLPDNFQGNLICSNGSRIYVSNPPADGAEDIYFSDDGGSNWTLTNSSGKLSFSNPWVQSMYAVDDYLFAAIKPANFQDAPPFLISSTAQPDFSVGDVSGLPTGKTNTNLPFFFHVGNKLFTMFWDLYSSEPGFTGETSTAAINVNKDNSHVISVYPNPAAQTIKLQTNNIEVLGIEIYSLTGQKVFHQNSLLNNSIDVSVWSKGVYLLNITSKSGNNYRTSFIKN